MHVLSIWYISRRLYCVCEVFYHCWVCTGTIMIGINAAPAVIPTLPKSKSVGLHSLDFNGAAYMVPSQCKLLHQAVSNGSIRG